MITENIKLSDGTLSQRALEAYRNSLTYFIIQVQHALKDNKEPNWGLLVEHGERSLLDQLKKMDVI